MMSVKRILWQAGTNVNERKAWAVESIVVGEKEARFFVNLGLFQSNHLPSTADGSFRANFQEK